MRKKENMRVRRVRRLADSMRFEISFFGALVAEKPDYVEALIALGDVYTKAGLHEEGLAVDRRLAHLRPEDPIVHYNLACSCSLLGRRRAALSALRKAIELGYRDWQHMEEDDDLDCIRKTKTYKNLILVCKSSCV